MGPRPCVYGTPLELDRIYVVWRLPGWDRHAADRRLGRHLWVELRDGPCRLTAGLARGVASTADLRRQSLGSRCRGDAFNPRPRSFGNGSTDDVAYRRHRDLAASSAALDPPDDKM